MKNLNPLYEHEFIWGFKTEKNSKKRNAFAKILRAIRRGDDVNSGLGRAVNLGIAGTSALMSAGTGYAAGGVPGAMVNAGLSAATSPFLYLGAGVKDNPVAQTFGNAIRHGSQYIPGLRQTVNGVHDAITDNSARARMVAKTLVGPNLINRHRMNKRSKANGQKEFVPTEKLVSAYDTLKKNGTEVQEPNYIKKYRENKEKRDFPLGRMGSFYEKK